MMRQDPVSGVRPLRRLPWQSALLAGALAFGTVTQAQVILNEDFTGGASTTGFTIDDTGSDCAWLYAPGGLNEDNFNQDFGGSLPSGGGFDSDFAFLDADECGSSGVLVNSFLVSPAFDASAAGNYILSFSQQFRGLSESFARVEVYNGTTWSEAATYTSSVGYPNPAVTTSLNITSLTGGSAVAKVRFQYSADWDWWWAVDNIVIERAACAAPEDLAVTGVSTDGGTIGWLDNGSAGYEWAVTESNVPDGTNEVASGDGTNLTIEGLSSGTPYFAFVRSDCGDGVFSPWSSPFAFTTGITNDECSGAVALTVNPDYNCGTTTPGTVAGATGSGVTSTCFGTADDDVWFSFTATATAHTISLNDVSGSTSDMYMALWTGDCGSLTLVPNSCSDYEEALMEDLTVGTVYYLQVYTYTSSPGQNSAFQVCVGTAPAPPANDECAGALDVPVNPDYDCASTTPGTLAGATDSGVTSTCFGSADDDVWFSFTATNASHRVKLLNIQGSTSDLFLALWEGDCGTLTQVTDGCSDNETANFSNLTVGETYYLQVYSYTSTGAQTTNFDVCVGTAPTSAEEYCNTLDFEYGVEPICNVTFADINNDSPIDNDIVLEDFTDIIGNVRQGSTYPLSVTGTTEGNYTDYVTAYFDWDQNNIFETAVPIGDFTDAVCDNVITAQVTVPSDAVLGTTRMRIVKTYDVAPTDPCLLYDYGQGEDYSLQVDLPTGVQTVATHDLVLMPNPAHDRLTLISPNGSAKNALVYDMVGSLMMSASDMSSINIANLAPGNYILVAQDAAGIDLAHLRFVKQ